MIHVASFLEAQEAKKQQSFSRADVGPTRWGGQGSGGVICRGRGQSLSLTGKPWESAPERWEALRACQMLHTSPGVPSSMYVQLEPLIRVISIPDPSLTVVWHLPTRDLRRPHWGSCCGAGPPFCPPPRLPLLSVKSWLEKEG